MPQLRRKNKFEYERLRSGVYQIALGLFKKMVIADRMAILVDTVYSNPAAYNGFDLILATVFFAFQIYCDFSGYSDIAIGTARILGYDLSINFKSPYFSKSVTEFWRRWHITLGRWFKNYVYIPFGGNRKHHYRNLFMVFFLSGLWHGASWNFAIWGIIHGLFVCLEAVTLNWRNSTKSYLKIDQNQFGVRLVYVLITFIIVNLAWVFFRASSFNDALGIINSILDTNYLNIFSYLGSKSYLNLGLDTKEFNSAIVFLMILVLFELFDRNGKFFDRLKAQTLFVRWSTYLALLYIIVMYGIYGTYNSVDFIYFQF